MEQFECIDTLRASLRHLTHPAAAARIHAAGSGNANADSSGDSNATSNSAGDDGGTSSGSAATATGLVDARRLRVVAAKCDWAELVLSDCIVLEARSESTGAAA